ncbi:hypothetical protein [Luedemannella helvata]|uniref:DUF4177 domain-containing protein n=1 Tax=Luedemannella helvata TaxID=349315 RepID=A0ABP4WRT7_9ACTN
MADEIKYEYKTVRTVRGTDGMVISKMQKDGWELVEQAQGTLRSTLNFRRPRKPIPRLLIGAAAAVLVLIVVIGVANAISAGGEKKDEPDQTAAAAREEHSATPPPAVPESAATDVITPQNNPEFAALLKADYCDDANLDLRPNTRVRSSRSTVRS